MGALQISTITERDHANADLARLEIEYILKAS